MLQVGKNPSRDVPTFFLFFQKKEKELKPRGERRRSKIEIANAPRSCHQILSFSAVLLHMFLHLLSTPNSTLLLFMWSSFNSTTLRVPLLFSDFPFSFSGTIDDRPDRDLHLRFSRNPLMGLSIASLWLCGSRSSIPPKLFLGDLIPVYI